MPVRHRKFFLLQGMNSHGHSACTVIRWSMQRSLDFRGEGLGGLPRHMLFKRRHKYNMYVQICGCYCSKKSIACRVRPFWAQQTCEAKIFDLDCKRHKVQKSAGACWPWLICWRVFWRNTWVRGFSFFKKSSSIVQSTADPRKIPSSRCSMRRSQRQMKPWTPTNSARQLQKPQISSTPL